MIQRLTIERNCAMTNTNCLQGIKCPRCGYEDRFLISATITADVTDDGSEIAKNRGDFEWDDRSRIECHGCGTTGTVGEFSLEHPEVPPTTTTDSAYQLADDEATDVAEAEAAAIRCEPAAPSVMAALKAVLPYAWNERASLSKCGERDGDPIVKGELEACDRALDQATAAITDGALEADAAVAADVPKIRIEVRGGVVQDVSNVPPGWHYQIVDYDDLECRGEADAGEEA
jgi:hypothetical protein